MRLHKTGHKAYRSFLQLRLQLRCLDSLDNQVEIERARSVVGLDKLSVLFRQSGEFRNDRVFRARRNRQNRMKLRAARIEKADYEAVYAGMTRCSKFSGHDQSMGVPADLPKFDVIKADLDALRLYVTAANKRKKQLEEEGKAFEVGPVEAAVLE
ncbi:hypothetical protein OZ411_30375 [Bradyrhizobium sp. Arg237L]|uniref:hypothetical protein n=1 Tax=Bradyrhizobium sp. Arg237L TaxID=3003352 RepID=UPI00249E742A|nr:hypothetical protein [Bradyrhizobium sp. Arg237L]MDI4237122.1 hypothetical protein [Bradyrhizobium sp. Arg237L]